MNGLARARAGLAAALVCALLLAACGAGASGHRAAERTASDVQRAAPFGMFGVVLDVDRPDGTPLTAAQLQAQASAMARAGVESLRATFTWAQIEPRQGVYDWGQTDALVTAAAAHGLRLLPDLLFTPTWASSRPRSATPNLYAPRRPALFAAFAAALVHRYGPDGGFWRTHPRLAPDPLRQWQIWNEEGFSQFWRSSPWAPTYTALLKVAYRAIHGADPGAQVVPGSLVDSGPQTQWAEMTALYHAGAGPYFDVVSVHPFVVDPKSVPGTVELTAKIVAYVRAVMKHHGDARKPVILSELTWPAAVGIVPHSRLLGLEATPAGARARLAAAYAYLVAHRAALGVTQAYWYTWASSFDRADPSAQVSYDFAGLNRITATGGFVPQPILATYAATARRLEGCTKTADARICR